jgi:hypothetical protein
MNLRLGLFLLVGSVAACGATPEPGTESTAEGTSAIINGTADTTHPAAVAYFNGSGAKCTATIVHKSGTDGYALTAAHCIGGGAGYLRQGESHANGAYDFQYAVDNIAVHPDYGKAPYFDFAMLHFSTANVNTAVMPALSPAEDDLQAGFLVTLVGYGQIEGGGQTTIRRSINRNIQELNAMSIVYNQASGGQCFGDSGGPSVRQTPGGDRVAAVASSVSDSNPDCTGLGFAMQVSKVYDTFIMPYINGTAFLQQGCAECYEGVLGAVENHQGACFQPLLDCFGTAGQTPCEDYLDCLIDCSDPLGCANSCATAFPAGAAMYDDILSCPCDTGCASECAGAPECSPPTCGYLAGTTLCNSCLEGKCCAEAQACADDASCASCFPNCPAGEPSSDALLACLGDGCATACDVEPLVGGSSGVGGAGGAGGGSGTTTGAGGTGLVDTGGAGGEGGTKSGGGDAEDDGGCQVSGTTGAVRGAPAWLALALGAFASAGIRRRRRAEASRPRAARRG